MTEVLTDTKPIRLKGRSFLALVLSPEPPFDDWLARLDDLAARSAGFFLRRPIVLDVDGLEMDGAELRGLIEQLRERHVRIMGIEGADPTLLGSDMPPAMAGGLPASDLEEPDEDAPEIESEPAAPSLMVTQPVRSGQLLTSEGDITIVGSVASGAEVIAGGSVHVYGTIRGRVVAGSMGNDAARIFCRKLEAELVAIAGYYKTSEDFEDELRGQAVQLWLENEAILGDTQG
ncbi:septum site-determining protein MinC [Nitratireductor sp. XY-223]|uniref:septum site-determining protein MinC n=1 Tax=Nitratireductor sp. XY-223 TaxID=2561926 RepID=UPI0010A9E8DF|nr:septum site-determining protein MinC [Nitratireductor sp. XY-223]